MLHTNNINILRLLAAFQVLLSHSVGHLGIASEDHPAVLILRMFPGVPIFFLLSGFLIYKSWTRQPNLRSYFIKRALRIVPALWLSFFVTLVMLAILGQIDGGPRETIVWIISQFSLLPIINPDFLRDFGVGVVNGSLWSIPVEVQFYLLLPFIAVFFVGTAGPIIFLTVTGVTCAAYLYLLPVTAAFPVGAKKLLGVTILPYLFAFGVGMAFARYDRLLSFAKSFSPILFLTAYAAVYGLIIFALGYEKSGRLLNPIAIVFLSFFIFSIAYGRHIPSGWFRAHDISYGVYLYHMIFINLVIHVELDIWSGFLVAFALTIAFASFSWLFCERIALQFKPNARGEDNNEAIRFAIQSPRKSNETPR